MNRIDRLTGIVMALQGGSRTAHELARRFEISRRTIMRDIDALGELGVPIVSRSGRSGGYHISEGFWLPPLHLTADEATVLLFALDHLGDSDTSPLGASHRRAYDKLGAVLNPDVRASVARNLETLRVTREYSTPHSGVLETVRTAISRQRWCTIEYQSPNTSTTRSVLPKLVYTASGRWYLQAIDSLRRAERVFRVDRIAAVAVTADPPNAPSIVAEATTNCRPYDDPGHPEVHALLTARGLAFALDHPDLRESVRKTETGGEIRFRCPERELPYFGRELLRLGTDVRLLRPNDLRIWMTSHLTELLSHVRSGGDHAV